MSVENVREYLRGFGLADRVQEYETSSATVELAAQAVGVAPARIAKTLSFRKDEGCILVLAAGDARIDNRKFRETFGMKAKMPSPEEVLAMVGHPVGGVCPFAIQEGVAVYLDESLRRFDMVYPAAGSASSAVGLTPEELYRVSKAAAWVDVCKLPETES